MSDIKMSVVNSTVGLGETEYSLCDNKGMLKYDKSALDECCEIINTHDAMQARITELEKAISGILNSPHTKLTKGALLEVSEVDIDTAIKALEK